MDLTGSEIIKRFVVRPNPFEDLKGREFTEYFAELLRQLDYINVKVVGRSRDRGGDTLAEKDGVRYVYQCKGYASFVGPSIIGEVLRAITHYGVDVGVAVTNSRFTSQAREEGKNNRVLLIDKYKIYKMSDEVVKKHLEINASGNRVIKEVEIHVETEDLVGYTDWDGWIAQYNALNPKRKQMISWEKFLRGFVLGILIVVLCASIYWWVLTWG